MTWWYRLLRRSQVEDQLEKELRFHLDQHAADLIEQGKNPEEARREARLALGGPEQVKERCRDARGTRWLEDLAHDVRYAIRTLRQRPAFTAVAMLTLALGSGATTVMFTVINGVLLKPLAYPEPEKLVTIHAQTEKHGEWGVSYLDFLDCRRESRSFEPVAAWTYGGGTVSAPGEAEYVDGRKVSAELFSVLGIPLLHGRGFLPDEDQRGAAPVAVISYGLWQQRYGGSLAAIGMPLVFEGKPCTVVGIMPSGLRLDGEVGVYIPLGQSTELRMQNRQAHFLHVIARLRPGVTPAEAQMELALLGHHLAEQYPESNEGLSMASHPLKQEEEGDVGSTLWLLLGAVSLLLIIACANIASLLLARAVSRKRELALRVALGAGRGRLVRQFLTESAVLGLGGGLLGVLLAAVGIRPFVAFWPGSLPRAQEVMLDWHVLLFALAVSLACGLVFGLAPALLAPGRDLEEVLRAGARSVVGASRRLHAGFVISEIALAVVLLISAGILGRTLLQLSSLDPGINVRNLLTARVALSPSALTNPARARAAWQDFQDRARRVPGIQSVALSDIIPMRVGDNVVGYWPSATPRAPSEAPLALASCVSPDYPQTMGLPLLRGRFLDEHDGPGSDPVVVIDENMARHAFGTGEAVGKQLWIQAMGTVPVQIVGVVGHVRHWGLASDDGSQVQDQLYYPFAQIPDSLIRFFSSVMSTAIRTNTPPLTVVEALRREVRGAAGDQVLYDVFTMEQLATGSLARQRFLVLLFGIFAGLALLLACIGIYGVLAYLTGQRVPEMGVRMALGASPGKVMRLVLRQSVGMILLGVGLGVIGALAAGRVLERLVDGMRPVEPLTFAIMIPALVAAALFASFLPARRASRIDPMTALHQE